MVMTVILIALYVLKANAIAVPTVCFVFAWCLWVVRAILTPFKDAIKEIYQTISKRSRKGW